VPSRRAALVVAAVVTLGGCSGAPRASPSPSGVAPPSASGTPAGPSLPADVATGLAVAWGLAFLPDGSALVTVRDTAEVLRVGLGTAPQRLGRVPDVAHGGEGGLLGVAVSPTFDTDRAVFVYHTTAVDNRVVRLRLEDLEGEPRLEVDRAVVVGIPRAGNHNGGRIAFGPDGFLYVATGDAGDPSHAQDLDSLGGKILRVGADGEPAPGNPVAGSPVWSWGHRNVQGLAWDSGGRLFASEFGQSTWDELNIIEPGQNYGWPLVEGTGGEGEFADPAVQWRPGEASPSGIAVLDGAVYVAALRGESLWRVPLEDDGEGVGEPQRLLRGVYGRLRAVEPDGEGRLWLLTSNAARGQAQPGDDRVVVVDPQSIG
jgi:glucose/arabinose dehydrogenase